MPKVHIALVGGQATPVYQGIVYTKPDQVILVCSEQSKKDADSILEKLPSLQPSLQSNIELRVFSDSDLVNMEESVRGLMNEVSADAELSVNLSSGLKVWTVLFYGILHSHRPDSRIFCLSQDGLVFDITAHRSNEHVDFDMDAQFRLLGNEVASYTSYADYTAEDRSVLNIVRSWGLSSRYHMPLKDLTDAFLDKAKGRTNNSLSVIVKESRLKWDPSSSTFTGKLLNKEFTLHSPHVWHILLNTGWFEAHVASLLASIYPPKDIRLNCIFKSKTDAVKNEVDIIVNTGKKLIFVECKTQVSNTTDVDKFASVVRTYGGLGSKALFITNSPMKNNAQEKCDEKGIETFYTTRPDVSNLQELKELMKQMLDKLVNSWNTK